MRLQFEYQIRSNTPFICLNFMLRDNFQSVSRLALFTFTYRIFRVIFYVYTIYKNVFTCFSNRNDYITIYDTVFENKLSPCLKISIVRSMSDTFVTAVLISVHQRSIGCLNITTIFKLNHCLANFMISLSFLNLKIYSTCPLDRAADLHAYIDSLRFVYITYRSRQRHSHT